MKTEESTEQRAKRRRVALHVHASPGSTVHVAGSFNDWSPDRHPLTYKSAEGVFSVSLLLEPGRYEYKFVVNGVWCIDPECPNWAPSGQGSLNSVLNVE
jgi:1,4-alpha-glucan branching enzyme